MTTESKQPETTTEQPRTPKRGMFNANGWLLDVLLVLVLVVAAALRLSGLDWDAGSHLHPDERFLTQVESALVPVGSLSEYFDTARSTLNPANVGFDFFVYGTFPIFVVRYIAEWLEMTAYDQVYLVGRALAGGADVLIVGLVYLIGARLYDRRVGLFAAIFSAFTVLQIQIAHYFTVDTFLTLFTTLTIYMAVLVATSTFVSRRIVEDEDGTPVIDQHPDFRLIQFVLFGALL